MSNSQDVFTENCTIFFSNAEKNVSVLDIYICVYIYIYVLEILSNKKMFDLQDFHIGIYI